MPVFTKGNKQFRSNYRSVSVMGPFAKLYATCLNLALAQQAKAGGWWASTQAVFRQKQLLEDLVVPVDCLLDRAYMCKLPLSMCLVDLEKPFDKVNQARLLKVLQGYGVGPDMLEAIR